MYLLLSPIALASGPFGILGATVTPEREVEGIEFSSYFGPTARLGYEFGDRFNHEISVQFTHATGGAEKQGYDFDASLTTYAMGYRFAVDILTKKPGFTPYVGTGLNIGFAEIAVEVDESDEEDFDVTSMEGGTPFLELHVAVGGRYCFESGLNLRAELVGSTYGGFFGIQPGLGAGYQF